MLTDLSRLQLHSIATEFKLSLYESIFVFKTGILSGYRRFLQAVTEITAFRKLPFRHLGINRSTSLEHLFLSLSNWSSLAILLYKKVEMYETFSYVNVVSPSANTMMDCN